MGENLLDDAGQGVSNAIDTGQKAKSAINTGRKLASLATKSGGNPYAAAALAAKEAAKDPKTLRNICIAILLPLFLVLCLMMIFGSVIIMYVQEVVGQAIENSAVQSDGSYEDRFLKILGYLGLETPAMQALREEIAYDLSPEVVAYINEGSRDENGKELGDAMSDTDLYAELKMPEKERQAAVVFLKRLTMIKKSAVARIEQYVDDAESDAQFLIERYKFLILQELDNYIDSSIDEDNVSWEELKIVGNDLTISSYQAAAILALCNTQYNQNARDVGILTLRKWLGSFSYIESWFDENEIEPASGSTTITIRSAAVGGDTITFDIPMVIEVPWWHGSFVPQYVLEQWWQDKAADELAASNPNADTNERGTDTAEYPESVGFMDTIVEYTGITLRVDLDYNEDRTAVKISPVLDLGIRVRSPEDMATNIVGLWKGALDEHDESGKNRESNNSDHPDILSYSWTDSRGVNYERTEGYQYEYFMTMLEGYTKQYNLEGSEEPDAGGSPFDDHYEDPADSYGADIVAEANRIYNLYHNDQSAARRYVWSEYFGVPSSETGAWCCAFVYVCAKHCGYVGPGKIFGQRTAWCSGSLAHFRSLGQVHTSSSYVPKPGDLIYYKNIGESGLAHIGIVEYYENGNVHTIEGNGLYKHTYRAAIGTNVYGRRIIYAYASPAYPAPDDTTPAP